MITAHYQRRKKRNKDQMTTPSTTPTPPRSTSKSPSNTISGDDEVRRRKGRRNSLVSRGGALSFNPTEREYILRSIGRCHYCGTRPIPQPRRLSGSHNTTKYYGEIRRLMSRSNNSSGSSSSHSECSSSNSECTHCGGKHRDHVPEDIFMLSFGSDK